MKKLLCGVTMIAALAIAPPVFAQNNPSGGNPVGTLGPNPGGPGLTPYTGGGPGPTAPVAAPPPTAAAAPNSVTPPSGHHHRMYKHAKAMRHFHKAMAQKAALTGDTTAQLNREELARIQTGNLGNPPAPPAPVPGK
jgi:hypothetical protein